MYILTLTVHGRSTLSGLIISIIVAVVIRGNTQSLHFDRLIAPRRGSHLTFILF